MKKNDKIAAASAEEVAFFRRKKNSFDPVTGLNLYGDERLIRSREAMVLAVTIFNSGSYRFKTGVFAVHLLHEYARIHFFSSTLREYAHMAIVDVLTGSPPAA